jgi:hypothetical protein
VAVGRHDMRRQVVVSEKCGWLDCAHTMHTHARTHDVQGLSELLRKYSKERAC